MGCSTDPCRRRRTVRCLGPRAGGAASRGNAPRGSVGVSRRKLMPGESREAGLARELAEELGIRVLAACPLIRTEHRYPDRDVVLDVWSVGSYSGEPHGREGQRVEWREVRRLDPADFPPADAPVLAALRLPRRYLVTPEPGRDWNAFLDRLAARVDQGFDLVQLRAKVARRVGPDGARPPGGGDLPVRRGDAARERGPRSRTALRRWWRSSHQPATGPDAARAARRGRSQVNLLRSAGAGASAGCPSRGSGGPRIRDGRRISRRVGWKALPGRRLVSRRGRSRTGTGRGLRLRGSGTGTGDPDPSGRPGAPMGRLRAVGAGGGIAGVRDRRLGRRRRRCCPEKRRTGRRRDPGVLGRGLSRARRVPLRSLAAPACPAHSDKEPNRAGASTRPGEKFEPRRLTRRDPLEVPSRACVFSAPGTGPCPRRSPTPRRLRARPSFR